MKKKALLLFNYFSKGEKILWCSSMLFITVSFLLFGDGSTLSFTASLIGTTSLIFNAKGNPLGPFLMIVFSLIYGAISFSSKYYGEMVTYLGMTMPMSVFAVISWLNNPYKGNKAEVKVNSLKCGEILLTAVLTAAITLLFYYILKALGTANLLPSTLSVSTSFLAVYLTFRRSAHYALAYAANDIILIVLWSMAAMKEKAYISVAVCFVIFLANDIYGYISWSAMKKRQNG